MDSYVLLAVLGLATGAVYAGLGMGVVTTFRATGVMNVGQVGLGMWGAFVADELHTSGALVMPWVGIPSHIALGSGWPVWPAAAVGVLSAAALGIAVQVLVFRPLRRAPQLAKIVATVGLLLTVQALIVHAFGNDARQPDPMLTTASWDVFGGLPVDRLVLAGLVIGVALLLAALQRWTLLGVAVRANAEDETSVALAGWSPNGLAATGWGVGAAVSALLIILAAPTVGLSPNTFPALLVPGLACALVGRLSSLTATAVAALALGAFQADMILLASKTWWPGWARTGLGDALPFLVVVVALLLTGRKLPERGSTVTDRLPPAPRNPLRWSVVAATVAAGAVLLVATSGTYRFGAISTLVFAFFMLSLVVVTGLVGQVSLAQAAVGGASAFVMVKATHDLAFPLNIVVGVAAATIAGLLIGVPALRIRHGQLAVVTLAAAVAVGAFVFNNPVLNPPGQGGLPAPHLFGVDFAVRSGANIARLPFALLVLALLALACLFVARLTRGRWGRRFLAVRDDERAAAAAGVNVSRTKLAAFALSSGLAGLGGALLAYSQGQASADSFTVLIGLSFVVYAYLGGITSVSGALVAAALAPAGLLYVILDNIVDLSTWYALISSVGLVVAILQNPEGAVGSLARLRERLRGRRHHSRAENPRATPPASLSGPGGLVATTRIPVGRVLLDVRGVSVQYGGVTAVSDVSFQVRSGEVVGLIGANGAGKSSLIDAITGFTPHSGEVLLGDQPLAKLDPAARYRAGLARTWQTPSLFVDLTVGDNVAVAAGGARPGDMLRDVLGRPERADAVQRALAAAGAEPLANQVPTQLSTGQQRTAALARALANSPTVLLADEPAAGLDPEERLQLTTRLHRLANDGMGVLLVEHDLDLVLRTCDRLVVLDLGHVIADGNPDQVRTNPAVRDAYLGPSASVGTEELTTSSRDSVTLLTAKQGR
ncbi:ABC transporter permease subunit [Marmoricola sp. RAF53]|uniref:ABC transporter permease subunit n=1 Tax=Marmoricola sp. RAF53 TaxID=3233059 RepID=UPI003F9E0725